MSRYGGYRLFDCGELSKNPDHSPLLEWAKRDYERLAERIKDRGPLGPMEIVVKSDHPAGEPDSYGWFAEGPEVT